MNNFSKKLHSAAFWASIVGVIAFLFDYGFSKHDSIQQVIDAIYFIVITIGLISTFVRYIERRQTIKKKIIFFDTISVLITLYVLYVYIIEGLAFENHLILENPVWLVTAVILAFFRSFSEQRLNLSRAYLNPAQLFIVSFLIIILTGTFLLLMPHATHGEISFINALFTSTSAVCVTGLAVEDTGTFFTPYGQSIIMVLIQIGGLGILTFASYFTYFFKGGSTFENQLTLSEMTNSKTIGNVFDVLKNIIIITAVVEMTSSIMIYFSLDSSLFSSRYDQMFFSLFHGISAFCNAGFSTLSNSTYTAEYRFNYPLQLIIIATFVMGGLGFPIVVNIVKYFQNKIIHLFKITRRKKHKPWILSLNSRIALITTFSLTGIGLLLFIFLEYNNTLTEHGFLGKVVHSLFGVTTPRTAGFNSIDMSTLRLPTVMLVIFLMWVGASPASTGGGIKTNTLAIALMSITSLAKGKDRIEVFRREISEISIRRAFATITLSIFVVGIGIGLVSICDSEKGLRNIAFEVFSAYSTAGLSLGITGDLSNASKIIIIIIMFVGRVSMLSIMVSVFKKSKHKNYRYPKEEITIN